MGKQTDACDIILVDADVTLHFLFAQELGKFQYIYPGQIHMLDQVYNEVTLVSRNKTQIDSLLHTFKFITPMQFPDEAIIKREYAALLKEGKGKGESACMAVARHKGFSIASSNWTDIAQYCNNHKIRYYTTMDLLHHGLENDIFSEVECDQFIAAVIGKEGTLPVKKMSQYLKMVKEGHRADLYLKL